ncbi:hypothetical protein KEM54_006744 [Ascosphaera aggregata]|nr:hypothetical protein KEM54_006744 [Ascosphaera aggregata]
MGSMVTIAGRKRLASEALDGEQQKLSKKFNQLHIGRQLTHVRLAAPISPPESVDSDGSPERLGDVCIVDDDEFMDVEDTKHRIYVSNLEREIREIEKIEKQEKEPILLPGLEKLIYNPRALSIKPPEPTGNQLVLYKVPASISIPEHRDSVMRALTDARDRAAKKFIERGRKQAGSKSLLSDSDLTISQALFSGKTTDEGTGDTSATSPDYDVMDIDDEL